MSYRVLEWDSRFFGRRVAQLTVDDSLDGAEVAACLAGSDADVVYVFLDAALVARHRPVLERCGGQCYDCKVTFGKPVGTAVVAADPEVAATLTESEELLQLAYASGHRSRFFLDPRFRPHFQALYAAWLRKDLRGENARVFTLGAAGQLQGLVTTSVNAGAGRIGLLAIAEACRGKGLGLRLLKQCDAYYASVAAHSCCVVTQKDNVPACRLYAKAGYAIESEQAVWHVWKQ